MATESGLVFDFSKVDLVIGAGFRCDAFADAGFAVNWTGDVYTVATGADDKNIIVRVGNTAAVLTANMMQSAVFITYVSAWLTIGNVRRLSFEDRNGLTFMSAPKAIPRQNPNLIFNNAHNPRAIDIHCPNLRGVSGGLT